ncbi:DUF4347 domain-containing protein [Nisaea sp.]|uniref:DUF4347 domain-containing protein n=1 Tax=Nisaea sp. TaxID=2024842 RepID=UPI002B2699BA|nr:DUF4347 domain-containing protein [Nisaea sp.]
MKNHETILFVDSSVRHAHLLVEGLDPDARVHRLSSWSDPLAEIAAVVSRAAPVGHIAILTHGGPGTFTLSGQRVDRETLSLSAEALAKIRVALAPGADVLLMSCSTGAHRAGREFIAGLEAHLGVPVHASETDIGADAGWSGLAAAATIFAPSALASYPERLGPTVISGSSGNDTLTGTAASDTIRGNDGNDVISGLTGDDDIATDDGNDLIYGGDGNDTISSLDGTDTIYGGSGNDLLASRSDNDLIYGGDGNDTLTGNAGNDTLYGDAGNDLLYGGDDADLLIGGAGSDTFKGSASEFNGDTISGLEAGDTITVTTAGADASALNGTTLGSTIDLGSGYTLNLSGAASNLTISAVASGSTTTLTFSTPASGGSSGSSSGSGLTVTSQTSADTAGTATGRTLVNNTGSAASGSLVEGTGNGNSVTATLPSGLSLTNSGTSTAVTSTAATTSLTQQIQTTEPVVGAQSFLSGHGQNFINSSGGMALDVRTIGFSGSGTSAQTVQIAGSTSASGSEAFVIDTSGLATGSTVQLDNIEFAAIVGSATINGGGGQNYVVGDDAAQFISLGAEDDTLAGGGGDDTVGSAWGEDIVYGNQGLDYVFGGGGMDTLYGGQDDDTVFGGNDNDVVYGNKGNDTLSGGENDDLLYGGQGNDIIYGNSGNDTLAGNIGNDTLYGGQGADYLAGDSGADLLIGNAGDDTLVGGDGADTFLFTAGGGNDQVNDFQSGTDSLQFDSGLTYTAAESAGNTVLTLSDGGTVTLIGVNQSELGVNASSGWDLM